MFRIGQGVVCVDDSPADGRRCPLIKGREYVIAEVRSDGERVGIVGFDLWWFGLFRFSFRPLDEDYAEGVLSEIKKSTLDETLELLEQIKTKETI